MKTIIFSIACLLLSVSVVAQESTGLVQYEYAAGDGTITLLSKGFAKKRNESNKEAVANSFFALLFRGIAGSSYELPMIPDEQAKKNDPLVKALTSGEDMSFVISNAFVREETRTKKRDGLKGKETTYRITINCEALRRYLVKNGILRKFGI